MKNKKMINKYNEVIKSYKKIESLQEEYDNAIENRKQISIDIMESIILFIYRVRDLENEVKDMALHYDYVSRYVDDAHLILDLILKSVNIDEEKYVLKRFDATNISINNTNNDCTDLYGSIFVIGKKDVIENIESQKVYFRDEFSDVVDNILMQGESIVVLTENGNGIIVNPSYKSENLCKFDINVKDNTSNIDCYLYDDDLGIFVKKLRDYLNENGCDIDDIPSDELSKIILNQISKTKRYQR